MKSRKSWFKTMVVAKRGDPPRDEQRDLRQADTSGLESEIDRLVYQLYGLTEEEIRIVEGKA